MVSSRSIKQVMWGINIGYFIGAVPATWDPINCYLVPKYGQSYRIPFCHLRTPRSGFIWAGAYLLIQVLNILYLLSYILFLEHSNMGLYISSFLLVCFLFSTFVQLLIICFKFDALLNCINSFFLLDLKIRK